MQREHTNERNVLITGVSTGIGRATASLLASNGFRVFGSSRRPPEGKTEFEWIPLDVTSNQSVKSCVSEVLGRAGEIDVLINNAGSAVIGAEEEISIKNAEKVFETNFFGLVRMTNAVLPSMRKNRKGLIINIGSMAAWIPLPFHGFQDASKAAVISYSEALRIELKPFGIKVVTVNPGMVATHSEEELYKEGIIVEGRIKDYAPYEKKWLSAYIEGQVRMGEKPEAVANVILKILCMKNPAPQYFVGPEKRALWATKFLPSSVIESFVVRRFHSSKK
ncbi:MAG: SDR family NAD(P)-dependent oxidoreductase [Thermoplasmata archaeon]